MHDYVDIRLVADRQRRYLQAAERHRLMAELGEPRVRRAPEWLNRVRAAVPPQSVRHRPSVVTPTVAAVVQTVD
jgi:hypothetical protein